jgi:hypothetical protein
LGSAGSWTALTVFVKMGKGEKPRDRRDVHQFRGKLSSRDKAGLPAIGAWAARRRDVRAL